VAAGLVIHEAQTDLQQRRFPRRSGSREVVEADAGASAALGRQRPAAFTFGRGPGRVLRLDARQHSQYALDHHAEALAYALQFAGEMEAALAEKFVGLYVNHHTLDCGDLVRKRRRDFSTWDMRRADRPQGPGRVHPLD